MNRPPARIAGGFAHDPSRARTVLFGGATASGRDNSTWEWDGSNWRRLTPPVSPSPRTLPALGYHGASGRMILFGGNDGGTLLADTWAFDGSTWQQLLPATSPPAGSGHMIGDTARGRLVYVGDGTWEWDGANWANRSTAGPGPRATLAYDVLREHVVGVELFNWNTLRTWEWFSPFQARYAPFGEGCAGSAGLPVLRASGNGRPWIGDVLQIELDRIPIGQPGALITGASNTTWGAVTLPMSLATVGAPDCWLWVSTEVLSATASSQGVARWSLQIPKSPSLLGASFFQQGLVIDPVASPAGIAMSNGVRAVIGAR